MKLYLTGMPGCGKSTLGKKLASRLGYSFIDMDSYIEKKMGMFVEEIFTNYGEDYFRALEVKTLVEFRELDNVRFKELEKPMAFPFLFPTFLISLFSQYLYF